MWATSQNWKNRTLVSTVSLVEAQTNGWRIFEVLPDNDCQSAKHGNHLLLNLQVQEIFHSTILIVSTTFCYILFHPAAEIAIEEILHSWAHIISTTIVDLLLTMWVNRLDISFQIMRIAVRAAPWFCDFTITFDVAQSFYFNEEPSGCCFVFVLLKP